jgi:hypothetical protein
MPERNSETTRVHEFDVVAGPNAYRTEIWEGDEKIAEATASTQDEAERRASERANEYDEDEDGD